MRHVQDVFGTCSGRVRETMWTCSGRVSAIRKRMHGRESGVPQCPGCIELSALRVRCVQASIVHGAFFSVVSVFVMFALTVE